MTYQSLQTILVTSLILLLTACANNHVDVKTNKIESSISVKQVLYNQFSEWKAVKYRFGGLSKKGIDCSGFVYLTYLNIFSIQ